MVSPTLDKDAIVVDSGEKKAVDQPQKGPAQIPTIIISASTSLNAFPSGPAQDKTQEANDDDDVKLPVNLLGSISIHLNNYLDSLATDGEAKQPLIDNIYSLSKSALPSSIQPLYQSLC